MSADEYVRECPTCRAENPPDVMRCACGALLAGVDLIRKGARAKAAEDVPQPAASTVPVVCPFADCGQTNPPGSVSCVYCNRALLHGASPSGISAANESGLLRLPSALSDHYRIVSVLPAIGAEAELLIVEALAGGPQRVAKIYRHGIVPRREVQERIARVDPQYQVQMLESGISDGYAFEVMEYCERGSLRDMMAAGPLAGEALTAVIRELAAAIASVHTAGLVHRDLKPENVLVRALQPLALVLTDFSIASVMESTQRFTSVARTLPYAAPESLSGVIDGKSDYWALGMIVLEAALGRHPFAGLSEAVILHHLTTRSVDLAAIVDRDLRKLLRGLLLRDPAARWGADHLRRWLMGDATLIEPLDQAPGAGFAEPYRIASDVCQTPEQLAVALAKNWTAGIADLGNGQLLGWFRKVQKDHNVVRLLLDINFERKLHVDVQLLKLILHLAPGIPPVWRGESIALPAILAYATRALDGDADAAQWLSALYQFRVLETYAEAGNAQAADIVGRWNAASDNFEATWQRMLALIQDKAPRRAPGEPVDVDAARYGLTDPIRPSLLTMHPKLLAITYDPAWAERLRRRLLGELAELLVYCPWLSELGDPLTMDATSLLVVESLLPEARTAAERQIKVNTQRREEDAEACRKTRASLEAAVEDLQALAQRRYPTEEVCRELGECLERYAGVVTTLRASGRSDTGWIEMRNHALRKEPIAQRLRVLVDQLSERLAVNSGWLDWRVGSFTLLTMLVGPRFLGPRYLLVMLLIVAGVITWRLLPNFVLMRDFRTLAAKM